MDDNISFDRIQTNEIFDFKKLYNEINHNEDDRYSDSPFSLHTNDCKYFTPFEFSKVFHSDKISLSMFSINWRSLETHWDSVQELLFKLFSNSIKLDIIGLTEIF